MDDPKILAAAIAVLVTAALFVMGRLFEIYVRYTDRRETRRRLVHAIYTEINHNLEELKRFVDDPDRMNVELMLDAMKQDPRRAPFVVYARNMRFFDDMVKDAPELKSAVLDAVVRFYSQLEKVYAFIEAFGTERFRLLTDNGKRDALETYIAEAERAVSFGQSALRAFGDHYPASELPAVGTH